MRARGFTLLEMMIALVIAAILTAIALPAYRSYVLRSNRSVVRALLVDIAAKQEVESLRTGSYAGNFNFYLAGSNAALDNRSFFYIGSNGEAQAASVSSSIYRIDLSNVTAGTFTLSATAVNSQTADSTCTSLTLNSKGLRSSATGSDCWTR